MSTDLSAELVQLRRAVRALAGIDRALCRTITPEAMRRVCAQRGWTMTETQPLAGRPDQVGSEIYDHPTANHADRYEIPCVQIHVNPIFADYGVRVREWATDVATRHGDVAPAEILAEALAATEAP